MKKLVSLLLCLGLLAACDKEILKEEPHSVAVETFYNTPNEVESAVFAAYAPLRDYSCLGGEPLAILENNGTEYAYGRGTYAALSDYQGIDGSNLTRTQSAWEQFYLSIRNANLVIKNAPLGTATTEADKTKYVAEARFLRGLAYFYLVRCFGDVPIRTESNMLEQNLKRSTEDEVFTQIVADLETAEAELPDQVTQGGRATLWAAKAVLADVYFYQGKYPEARDKAKEVIDSKNYALVEVSEADDFEKLYGADIATTSEEVFHLKYVKQPALGNAFPFIYLHPSANLFGANSFYVCYSKSDNPFVMEWDENDLRKVFTFISIGDFGLGPTVILCKKFTDIKATSFDGSSNDYPMYRYADILLLYAEAASRAAGGPTPEGMEALNQVHRRAYGENPSAPSAIDFKLGDYTVSTFIDLVVQERGYETIFEGKRWFDLKRLGKEKFKAIIKAVKGLDVAEKNFLWPIPLSELNYNLAIDPTTDQNPGY